MMKFTDPLFRYSCEISYVSRCGKSLEVVINSINIQYKLGIILHISKYHYYVYVSTGHIIDGFPTLFQLNEDTYTWKINYRILFSPL